MAFKGNSIQPALKTGQRGRNYFNISYNKLVVKKL